MGKHKIRPAPPDGAQLARTCIEHFGGDVIGGLLLMGAIADMPPIGRPWLNLARERAEALQLERAKAKREGTR